MGRENWISGVLISETYTHIPFTHLQKDNLADRDGINYLKSQLQTHAKIINKHPCGTIWISFNELKHKLLNIVLYLKPGSSWKRKVPWSGERELKKDTISANGILQLKVTTKRKKPPPPFFCSRLRPLQKVTTGQTVKTNWPWCLAPETTCTIHSLHLRLKEYLEDGAERW